MVRSIVNQMVMEPRPDWNAMGPRLPAWFRPRLKKVNSRLVMQFIPPRSTVHPDGVHPSKYPEGVWTVCARIPGRTAWLAKRWVWNLSDGHGRYRAPGLDTIHLLREAQRFWRDRDYDALEREFARSVTRLKEEEAAESKARLARHVTRLCQAHVEMSENRVSMRGARMPQN